MAKLFWGVKIQVNYSEVRPIRYIGLESCILRGVGTARGGGGGRARGHAPNVRGGGGGGESIIWPPQNLGGGPNLKFHSWKCVVPIVWKCYRPIPAGKKHNIDHIL